MKFTDLVPNVTPWQLKISEIVGQNLEILGVELIETNKGTAYLAECNVTPEHKDFPNPVMVLLGGTAIRNQIDKLLIAVNTGDGDFPVTASVDKVKQGKNFYYMLVDPV
jgi:hypothetical protein